MTITTTTATSSTRTLTSTTTTTTTTTWNISVADAFCGNQLLDSVLKGDVREVRRMVVLREDLNCRTDFEYLLQLTLRNGQREMSHLVASTLVPGCPHLYTPNTTGATPLLMAADKGFTEVAVMLIVKGVNIMDRDVAGRTALHMAATWPETSATLLEMANKSEALALLSTQDAYGDLPLHRALWASATLEAGARAIQPLIDAALLIEAPLDELVNTANFNGDRPAHLTGHLGALQELQRHGARLGFEAVNGNGALPFHTVAAVPGSAASGALAFVAGYLNVSTNATGTTRRLAGDVDVSDLSLRTALHYAAGGGGTGNVRWLIDRGADIGREDVRGDTPLAYALRMDQTHLVLTFADYGGTPLQAVVMVGRFDVLRELVLRGDNSSFSVHRLDPATGRSAIYEAAERGNVEILEFFIEQGVDLLHMDFQGLTVLAAAAAAQQDQAVRLLLGRGALADQRLQNGSTALHVAARSGSGACVEALIAGGAKVDAADLRGRTPLHFSATGEATEVLIRRGATSRPTSDLGLLPLHMAAYAGRVDVLEALLAWRHGGDQLVDARAVSGDTPLHLAALGGSAAAVQLLLRWCADAEVRNNASMTADQYAATADLATLLRGASSMVGRCQCDCGRYAPGPLYKSSGWQAGCLASVGCVLKGLESLTDTVRCAPASQSDVAMENRTVPKGRWEPSKPAFACSAIASSAVRASPLTAPPRAFLLALLVTLLPLLLPFQQHPPQERPTGVVAQPS